MINLKACIDGPHVKIRDVYRPGEISHLKSLWSCCSEVGGPGIEIILIEMVRKKEIPEQRQIIGLYVVGVGPCRFYLFPGQPYIVELDSSDRV
jgi:hypothetical protein